MFIGIPMVSSAVFAMMWYLSYFFEKKKHVSIVCQKVVDGLCHVSAIACLLCIVICASLNGQISN